MSQKSNSFQQGSCGLEKGKDRPKVTHEHNTACPTESVGLPAKACTVPRPFKQGKLLGTAGWAAAGWGSRQHPSPGGMHPGCKVVSPLS